uniref:P2X purinoceptor 7-like n=1 Tax=Setaria digitata TaxID=48799 RepID=A0A915PIJ5_9BILA
MSRMDEARIARRRARYQLRRTSVPMTASNTDFFYRMAFGDVERRVSERKNYILSCHLREGRIRNVSDFCTCGHCKPVPHIPVCYAYCCCEAESVLNGNCAHAERLTQKMVNLECITEHGSFASVCLDKEVLNILAEHTGVCPNWLGNILTFTNREYRYLAYRSFSYWIHGREAKGNRMDPPLCVLSKIVERYPLDEKVSTAYPGLFALFGSCFFEEYEEGDDMWNYIDLEHSQ